MEPKGLELSKGRDGGETEEQTLEPDKRVCPRCFIA